MIITKAELVKKTGAIWALPKYDPKPGEFPFAYELSDSPTYHWQKGAIMVAEVELSAAVPAGIDLFQRALETLTIKESEALKKYNEEIEFIKKERSKLLLLSGPSTSEHDYEYVEGGILKADGTFVADGDAQF